MKHICLFTITFFICLFSGKVFGNDLVQPASPESSSLKIPRKIDEIYYSGKQNIIEELERHEPHTEHKRKSFRRKIRYMRRTAYLRKGLLKRNTLKKYTSKKNAEKPKRQTVSSSAYAAAKIRRDRILRYS